MVEAAEDVRVRKLVLVVEDELFLALDLDQALTDGGFQVQGPAATVARALDLIANEKPDAAVLDVTLGAEKVTPVAIMLKSLNIPFVLATASDAAELARHDVLAHVPNLGKPTDMSRLVSVIQNLKSAE